MSFLSLSFPCFCCLPVDFRLPGSRCFSVFSPPAPPALQPRRLVAGILRRAPSGAAKQAVISALNPSGAPEDDSGRPAGVGRPPPPSTLTRARRIGLPARMALCLPVQLSRHTHTRTLTHGPLRTRRGRVLLRPCPPASTGEWTDGGEPPVRAGHGGAYRGRPSSPPPTPVRAPGRGVEAAAVGRASAATAASTRPPRQRVWHNQNGGSGLGGGWPTRGRCHHQKCRH